MMRRIALFLFIVLGWSLFLIGSGIFPTLGLRNELRAMVCDFNVYAEKRGMDTVSSEKCEQ